jgi:hypothetical protein
VRRLGSRGEAPGSGWIIKEWDVKDIQSHSADVLAEIQSLEQ